MAPSSRVVMYVALILVQLFTPLASFAVATAQTPDADPGEGAGQVFFPVSGRGPVDPNAATDDFAPSAGVAEDGSLQSQSFRHIFIPLLANADPVGAAAAQSALPAVEGGIAAAEALSTGAQDVVATLLSPEEMGMDPAAIPQASPRYQNYIPYLRQGAPATSASVAPGLGASLEATAGTVYADYVRVTSNAGELSLIQVTPGQALRYRVGVVNTTGGARTVSYVFRESGPCGTRTRSSDNSNIGPGSWYIWVDTSAVDDCPGTYTVTADVTYNGKTTSRSITYATGTPAVRVDSVSTTDPAGTLRGIYFPDDAIRFNGQLVNSTSLPRNAYHVWSLKGPCGRSTLWSGYLRSAVGRQDWSLNLTVPRNCLGTYTFTLQVTYNGSTTSKSTTYSVVAYSGTGTVKVTGVRATDSAGNTRTYYLYGEYPRFVVTADNTTGSSATTAYTYAYLQGPCGVLGVWRSYPIIAARVETLVFASDRFPSSCPGPYTFTVEVTYKGTTTSKSTSFPLFRN